MHPRAKELIDRLDLIPHPEGGFYRETYRSARRLATPNGERATMTLIYFLLHEGAFSALHRVRSDEAWHHYEGASVELTMIDERGVESVRLGSEAGEVRHAVVPAETWQAGVVHGAYALVGCTVAPGFDFADFELPPRGDLLARFPEHAELVTRLTR